MIIQKKMNEKLLARQKNTILNDKEAKVQGDRKKNTTVPSREGQQVVPKKPLTG